MANTGDSVLKELFGIIAPSLTTKHLLRASVVAKLESEWRGVVCRPHRMAVLMLPLDVIVVSSIVTASVVASPIVVIVDSNVGCHGNAAVFA